MKDYSLISKSYHNYELEKRQHKRVVIDGSAEFYYLNGEKKEGEIRLFDISLSGLGFISQDFFAICDVLELIIDIPNYISMQIMCYITWRGHCDNGFLYGSQFVSMNNLNRDIIKLYLEENRVKNPSS